MVKTDATQVNLRLHRDPQLASRFFTGCMCHPGPLREPSRSRSQFSLSGTPSSPPSTARARAARRHEVEVVFLIWPQRAHSGRHYGESVASRSCRRTPSVPASEHFPEQLALKTHLLGRHQVAPPASIARRRDFCSPCIALCLHSCPPTTWWHSLLLTHFVIHTKPRPPCTVPCRLGRVL